MESKTTGSKQWKGFYRYSLLYFSPERYAILDSKTNHCRYCQFANNPPEHEILTMGYCDGFTQVGTMENQQILVALGTVLTIIIIVNNLSS